VTAWRQSNVVEGGRENNAELMYEEMCYYHPEAKEQFDRRRFVGLPDAVGKKETDDCLFSLLHVGRREN